MMLCRHLHCIDTTYKMSFFCLITDVQGFIPTNNMLLYFKVKEIIYYVSGEALLHSSKPVSFKFSS